MLKQVQQEYNRVGYESINAISVGAGGGIPETAKIIRQELPTIDSEKQSTDPQAKTADEGDVTLKLSPQAEQRLQAEAKARKQAETLQLNDSGDTATETQDIVPEEAVAPPPPPPPPPAPEESPQTPDFSFYELNEQRRIERGQAANGDSEAAAINEFLAQVAAAQESVNQSRTVAGIRPESQVDIFA